MRLVRVLTILAVAGSVVLSAQTSPLTAEQRAQFHGPYSQPEEPFRLIGNIYYVGAKNIASYLITTPQGHILVDTGTTEMTPVITASVQKLGFKLRDIKIMLMSHAHFDHVGGHADLKRLTGAQVMVMDADRQALESGVDRSALGGPGWKPVAIDRVLKDGEAVTLGGVTLTAHLTPGHTQGCTTWTMEAVQDGKKYQVALTGSVTINEGVHLVGNTRVPAIAEQYAHAFRVLHGIKADVFVAQHGGVFALEDKARRLAADPRVNPFVDPDGYQHFVERAEQAYLKQLAQEQKR